MIRPLKNTDFKNFLDFCQKKDSDFYITRNNKRLYLTNTKIAKSVFNNCLKNGEKCFIKESNNKIVAIMLIIGYSDHFERKYLKLLVTSKDDCRDLFRYLQWQKLDNLFIKSRKNNNQFVKYDEKLKDNKYTKGYKPSYFARKTGFKIIVVRDKEILLKKEEFRYEFNKKRS